VNPSFKLFSYNRSRASSFAQLDYQQWYMDLDASNQQDDAVWRSVNASDYFKLPPAALITDPAPWYKLARALQQGDDPVARFRYTDQFFSFATEIPYTPTNSSWCTLTAFAPGEC
jgi:hypothetical protein